MVYTSPVEALKFLKDHIKEIDFALAAVNMKEMPIKTFKLSVSRQFTNYESCISMYRCRFLFISIYYLHGGVNFLKFSRYFHFLNQ